MTTSQFVTAPKHDHEIMITKDVNNVSVELHGISKFCRIRKSMKEKLFYFFCEVNEMEEHEAINQFSKMVKNMRGLPC